MSLPEIKHPIFAIEVPSLKKTVKFRPFLTREEKILLMAKQSKKYQDVLESIITIISACVQEPLDMNSLSVLDLEWIFLKLRIQSVGPTVEVAYIDPEDNETRKFKIDLEQVKIRTHEHHHNKIKIDNHMGIKLRPQPYDAELHNVTGNFNILLHLLKNCIDHIWEGENIYGPEDYTKEELDQWIDTLPDHVIEDFKQHVNTMPQLHYEVSYKNKKGTEQRIVFDKLEDFFSLR